MEVLAEPEGITSLIKKLPKTGPILSLYLPIRPGLNFPQSYKAEAIDLLRESREAIPESNRLAHDAAATLALDFVRDQFVPEGQTLALFAGTEVHWLTLGLALPAFVRYQDGPFLAPLEAVAEDNPRVAVVCVDDREARIIIESLGQHERSIRVHDDVPGRQRQGGWAAFRFERDRAEHVETHLRHVAQRLEEVSRETSIHRIVLGGSGEVVQALRALLPTDLSALTTTAFFPLQMFESDSQILTLALPIAAEAEVLEENDLATRIKDAALAGGPASLDWDETLGCLAEGRVHLLALPRSAIGTPQADKALKLAWGSGARIDFIGPQAEQVLKEAAGVGALLRF